MANLGVETQEKVGAPGEKTVQGKGGRNMKKKVNGHVIEITNMETIEKGFEGLALGRLASSSIKDNLSDNSEELINELIEQYETVTKALPFPLHAIEEDVKYSMIAMFIQDKIKEPLQMWVNKGLYVAIDETRAIHFVAGTWRVVSITYIPEDNTNIEEYRHDVGYREYDWALKRLMNDEKLSDYYQVFMPGFVKACGGEPLVLKWEMGRLLDFGYVPEKPTTYSENRLVDVRTGTEYLIDIFTAGQRKSGQQDVRIDLSKPQGQRMVQIDRMNTAYDFTVYIKPKKGSEDEKADVKKLQPIRMDGLAAVFQSVTGKIVTNGGIRPVYRGVVDGDVVLYEVGGSIYRCSAKVYQKPAEIARGVELYGYQNGLLYFKKTSRCASGIKKETIYAYKTEGGGLLLCRISYRGDEA